MFVDRNRDRPSNEKTPAPAERALVPVVISIIGMRVAPVPVLRLLFLVRSGVFVRTSVVLGEVCAPSAIFVVVPIVIILVVFVVDPDLNAGLLRSGCGQH